MKRSLLPYYLSFILVTQVAPIIGQLAKIDFLTTIVDQKKRGQSVDLEEGCPLNYAISTILWADNQRNTWEVFEKNIELAWPQTKEYEVLLLNFRETAGVKGNPLDQLQSILSKEALVVKRKADLHYVPLPEEMKKKTIPFLFFKKKRVLLTLTEKVGSTCGVELPLFCLREKSKQHSSQVKAEATSSITFIAKEKPFNGFGGEEDLFDGTITPNSLPTVMEEEEDSPTILERRPRLIASLSFIVGMVCMKLLLLLPKLRTKEELNEED